MNRSHPPILKEPPHLPLVFASILGADFVHMGAQCREVLEAGADGLHVDVMDGHFVPNLTMGPDMVASLRGAFPQAYIDVHLMVEFPEQFVGPFAEAGSDCLTFHIEATLGRREYHERRLIEQIREAGCDVGVALNPPTPADSVNHILDDVDMVLVMSVYPGFAGQSFMPDVLAKTRALRERLPERARIQMDGGLNGGTAADVRAAGCEVIVAASALFNAEDRAGMVRTLRGQA